MTLTSHGADRRSSTRYTLPAAYTPISVRLLDSERFTRDGHAYNISASGLRFELDDPIAPGTRIAIRIALPGPELAASGTGQGAEAGPDNGPGRAVFAFATIVWLLDDADEPGPVRMGARFDAFGRAGDEQRLTTLIADGRYAIAA